MFTGLGDELGGRVVGIGAAERLADGLGRNGSAEAVAAEQQHVAGAQVDLELVDARQRLGAQGAAEDAAVGVRGRLFFAEAPVAHHLADQGMIVAELFQCAVAQQIGTAVADVREVARVAREHDGRERGAHARVLDVVVSELEDGGVGLLGGRQKRPAVGDGGGQRLGGEPAGDLARLGAAHAVADREQGRGHDEGVLVGLAVQADVGEGAGVDDESHRGVTPRNGRRSRRCAPGCRA